MRTVVLANTEVTKSLHTSTCKLTTYPLCAACQFGKQRQWPSPGKRSSMVKDAKGNLKKDKLFPRQCIAVVHYICCTKGRLFTSRGKTKDTKKTHSILTLPSQVENLVNQCTQCLGVRTTWDGERFCYLVLLQKYCLMLCI